MVTELQWSGLRPHVIWLVLPLLSHMVLTWPPGHLRLLVIFLCHWLLLLTLLCWFLFFPLAQSVFLVSLLSLFTLSFVILPGTMATIHILMASNFISVALIFLPNSRWAYPTSYLICSSTWMYRHLKLNMSQSELFHLLPNPVRQIFPISVNDVFIFPVAQAMLKLFLTFDSLSCHIQNNSPGFTFKHSQDLVTSHLLSCYYRFLSL